MPLSKDFDPQPPPTDQTRRPRCEQALPLKASITFSQNFTHFLSYSYCRCLRISSAVSKEILEQRDWRSAKHQAHVCRLNHHGGSYLVLRCVRVLPRGVHVEFVHSRCLFSFTPSCQQTVAGESAPCRERNHTEKIYDWTFVVFCYASLLICTEGGLIYCVLNIVLNIYCNAWFTCGIAAIMFLQGNVRFALLLCSQVSYVFSYSQRVTLHWNDGASAKASAIRIGSVKIFIMSTQMHINAVRHRVLSAS